MNPIDFNVASANALPSVNVYKSLFRPLATFGLNTFTLEQISSLLEKLMGGESKIVSDSSHSTESVGSWSKMCLFSQSLKNKRN